MGHLRRLHEWEAVSKSLFLQDFAFGVLDNLVPEVPKGNLVLLNKFVKVFGLFTAPDWMDAGSAKVRIDHLSINAMSGPAEFRVEIMPMHDPPVDIEDEPDNRPP